MKSEHSEELDQHLVLATASKADDQDRVLKHGDTFAVMNRYGDIKPIHLAEEGLYYEGTRFLSRWELLLGKSQRPLLLGSNIQENNILLAVDITNPDTIEEDRVISRGTLHVNRTKFLWNGEYYEKITIWNLGMEELHVNFTLYWAADFADVFEVRGHKRERRGETFPPAVTERGLVFQYKGLDGIMRRTRVECEPAPQQVRPDCAEFALDLPSKTKKVFYLTVACQIEDAAPEPISFDTALSRRESEYETLLAADAIVHSSNQQFSYFLARSHADLRMMISKTKYGPYPYAGIPWYSTIFGRDGLITALEMLWLQPDLARGVLLYLANHQATKTDAEKDSEPGKILHEVRLGELANLKEIPFGLYYGSADSTPLFVLLACEYVNRTGDMEMLDRIWPHVERALEWMERYGDCDGDGYVEYAKHSESGLVNQAWKDSHDSVFHIDGELARGPIAAGAVQAYVYEARLKAAPFAELRGDPGLASKLVAQAEKLKENFLRDFWLPELGCYALALDGDKRPCRVRSSNAGHCLFSGIATPGHAREMANQFMGEDYFSGWGIRTIAAKESRYSPISYHNGTIWPHDNAMIAYGLGRYGHKEATARLLASAIDISRFVEFHRVPELLCGFDRLPSLAPTQYPVACKPQAWASASVFMMLQACLGLTIDGSAERIHLSNPVLPEAVRDLRVKNLKIGKNVIDLSLQVVGGDVLVNVLKQSGDIQILINKTGRPEDSSASPHERNR